MRTDGLVIQQPTNKEMNETIKPGKRKKKRNKGTKEQRDNVTMRLIDKVKETKRRRGREKRISPNRTKISVYLIVRRK